MTNFADIYNEIQKGRLLVQCNQAILYLLQTTLCNVKVQSQIV